jgi:hypothetical protein
VGWILRLVRTGADGGGHSTGVMEINKPDDIGDIAHLGLNLHALDGYLAGQSDWLVNYAERHRLAW